MTISNTRNISNAFMEPYKFIPSIALKHSSIAKISQLFGPIIGFKAFTIASSKVEYFLSFDISVSPHTDIEISRAKH
jgi:hypothetical protein